MSDKVNASEMDIARDERMCAARRAISNADRRRFMALFVMQCGDGMLSALEATAGVRVLEDG